MNYPGLYRMIKDGVCPSSFRSFLGMSSSKRPDPDPILGVEVDSFSIGVVHCVVSVVKIGLQESESLPKLEVRMSYPGIYRIIENGVGL